MNLRKFNGTADGIGQNYGETYQEIIRRNVDILVKRTGCMPLPLNDPEFKKWVDDQEKVISSNWPWLIEEMHGVAEGAGVEYHDIFHLNLRVWQYDLYSGKASDPTESCSSLIIALSDGSIANIGALDDNIEYYCGMVKTVPDHGYSFMTFPITGTSWGNRGMNSAGLSLGESSQILGGLKRLPGSICADLAVRVILQTCATVAEVKAFCKQYPFTLNIACSDRNGDVFCAHQTTAGLFEVANHAPCAITNHIVDDSLILKLKQFGVDDFQESPTTRLRRGRLLEFANPNNGKCSAGTLRAFIADRVQGCSCSICPKSNIVLTYANPQAEPDIMWIAEPQTVGNELWTSHNIKA